MSDLYGKPGKSFTRTRRNIRRLSPPAFRGSTTSNRYNERSSAKGRFLKRPNSVQFNVSTSKRPRMNETSEIPFTPALPGVDPLFAAAAAAVMNAGFRPAPPAVDFSAFSGRPNTSANATVAAVAAAAMNAAALAAALGSPVTSTSTDSFFNKRVSNQLSRIYKSDDNDYSVISDSRLDKSRAGPTRSLHDDAYSNRRCGRRYEKKTCTSVADRLPHHLDNRLVATRTLFVGNLVQDITEEELRRVFERYGHIEDIDIKRPEPGTRANAYAFIRFVNLDVAHRAKMGMSGKLIGQFTCKIGYGKVQPTRCLWIGGLGSWMTYSAFTSLLDRFGKPERITWPSGKTFAHVLYSSVDLAISAADALRRYSPAGNERRMRVDFTDENNIQVAIPHRHQSANTSRHRPQRSTSREYQSSKSGHKSTYDVDTLQRGKHTTIGYDRQSTNDRNHRPSSPYRSPTKKVPSSRKSNYLNGNISSSKWIQQTSPWGDSSPLTSKVSLRSPDPPIPMNPPVKPPDNMGDDKNQSDIPLTISTVTNTDDLSTCLSKSWDGTFYLKSSSFPCRMHMLRGDLSLVGQFMTNHENIENGKYSGIRSASITSDPDTLEHTNELVCLRITQRMKLDPVKLDDVSQRINAAGNSGFCVLLAVPPPSRTCQSLDPQKQPYRPLRNLISYLRTKESAGVVLLNPQQQSGLSTTTLDGLPITGVLHAFPPCDFAFNMLKETAVRLQRELTKDDHLVVLLIRSTGTV